MQIDFFRPTPRSIGFREFLVLTATIMSCQALAVDAMLPALPTIAAQLGVGDENHMQWVVTAYIAGLGVGQLFWGVLSDRFGRRSCLLTGLALYCMAALCVGLAENLASLLGWRFLHGVAAASAVVGRSMIRDLYAGRQMARVMSLTFIVFIIVPVIAPAIGQVILLVAPWRVLLILFAGFGALVWIWTWQRLPESLHPEYRMTLTPGHLARAARRVAGDRASVWYTLAMASIFGSVIAYTGMVQQIFADIFDQAILMPSMFAVCAATTGVTSYVNSRIVERFGMRIISQVGLLLFIAAAMVHSVIALLGYEQLWTFVLLQSVTMGCVGLIIGNFGAMAMESMGPVAGIAASLQGCVGVTGGAWVATLIGAQFNGSTAPLALGTALCGAATLLCVLIAERGRLFQAHPQGAA